MLGSTEGGAEAELPVLPTGFTGGAFLRYPEEPRVRFPTGTGGGGAFVRIGALTGTGGGGAFVGFPEGPKAELAAVRAALGLLLACGICAAWSSVG